MSIYFNLIILLLEKYTNENKNFKIKARIGSPWYLED